MAARRARSGRVEDFDEHVGLGTVLEPSGERHPFHCTAIADGTRDIPVGAEVDFVLVPGRRGRIEATTITRR